MKHRIVIADHLLWNNDSDHEADEVSSWPLAVTILEHLACKQVAAGRCAQSHQTLTGFPHTFFFHVTFPAFAG